MTLVLLGTTTLSIAGAVTAVTETVAGSVSQRLGRTATDVAEYTLARNAAGDISFVKKSGAIGDAVVRSPMSKHLHEVMGDQALWVKGDARRLALFTKYGESAASAMYKYPGIAEDLIEKFGDDAIAILEHSSRQSAQRFAMLADDGLLASSGRSGELLQVLRRFGDPAMEFVWKNKGALTVSSVLATFLTNPQAYISGVAALLTPAIREVNWTLVALLISGFVFFPRIGPSVLRARRNGKESRGANV
jgi:hypothetical protein